MKKSLSLIRKGLGLTAISLALASCVDPSFFLGDGSSSGISSSAVASKAGLTSNEKKLIASLNSAKSLDTTNLIKLLSSSKNPYVKNEIIAKLTANLIKENKLDAAKYYLDQAVNSTDAAQNSKLNLLKSKLGELINDPSLMNNVANVDTSKLTINEQLQAAKINLVKEFKDQRYDEGLNSVNELFPKLSNVKDKLDLVNFTLNQLTSLSNSRLEALAQRSVSNQTNQLTGWYRLAQNAVINSDNTAQLMQGWTTWKSVFQTINHPASQVTPDLFNASSTTTATAGSFKNIAVLLPFDAKLKDLSNSIRAGFDQANKDQGSKAKVTYFDVSQKGLSNAYELAIRNNSDFIVGPLLSSNVNENSGYTLQLPQLMLNTSKVAAANACYFSSSQNDSGAATMASTMKSLKVSNPVALTDGANSSNRAIATFSSAWLKLARENVRTISYNSNNMVVKVRELLSLTPASTAVFFQGSGDALASFKSELDYQRPDNTIQIFTTDKANVPGLSQAKIASLTNLYFTDSQVVAEKNSTIGQKADRAIDAGSSQYYNLLRLYGIGYDAYKVAQGYAPLKTVKGYAVNGVTGVITNNNSNCALSTFNNVYTIQDRKFIRLQFGR